MILVYLILFFICMVTVAMLYRFTKIAKARRKGIYPLKGKATKEDISRLALAGERILAINVYRELHKCSLREARKAIAAINGNPAKS